MGSTFTRTVSHLRDSAQVGHHRNPRDWLSMTTPEQKKSNVRTGLIIASIAVVFFLGFFAKMYLQSHH